VLPTRRDKKNYTRKKKQIFKTRRKGKKKEINCIVGKLGKTRP